MRKPNVRGPSASQEVNLALRERLNRRSKPELPLPAVARLARTLRHVTGGKSIYGKD
ncbi:MAG TPA: hypothetical protein VKE30_04790 [Chthoniobacterales bacterium]|nr:hypothetical protein [Chthoniobacterales bacterium]